MNAVNADNVTEVFMAHRQRLLGIACRMLGSWSEAEDLVQDAYLRWHRTAREHIESPLAFLVTITTRLSLDRLRELKREREHCVVTDEPEATFADPCPSPEAQRIQAEEVSIAFDAVMERLGTDERTAFLLREIFDYDYPEVARLLGKAEPACRQLIHRARTRIRDSNRRFTLTDESRMRVMQKFQAAMATGSHPNVMALLSEPVEYVEPARATSDRCHKVAA
ncbi:ECF RNA polymerase sigma factor SigJ [Usitatibacter rugosus]|uniref:ECF RNA polymerase sigma factor SigJ n=1 Tax=Usitatibacter rugosus TaxID=2732067 RepID=A0A6M4GXP4_9PROT|nr:sigma-70 family RNA polymerase sigma factor [Usitatibacter rugosus]QJR11254.1 ECF RNA polymerase sigma factor SigJ [Usitatibacter rugosus]